MRHERTPLVSVVMPAYDRAEEIRREMEALFPTAHDAVVADLRRRA